MRAKDLIRDHRGTEVPAPGRWRIPNNHVTVHYSARTSFLHHVRGRARSAWGALEMADDLTALAIVLRIDPSPGHGDVPGLGVLLGDEQLDHIVLRARVTVPASHAPWRTRGEVEIATAAQPAPISIAYHGVYKAGEVARASLTVQATIGDGVGGRRRRGPVELVADVLAVGPPQRSADDPGLLWDVA